MKITDVLAALAALAQESRLGVFRALVQAGAAGLPAGQIGERLGLPGPTLSFHLAQLKAAHLVDCRRDGRSLIYAADYATMNAVVGYLLENCCAGDRSCEASPCAPTPLARKEHAKPSQSRSQGGRHEASARTRRRR
jgi:ArsR family transcriptional regulator, arsenate/arsenite/antimonite-responsive transcriptional repressor